MKKIVFLLALSTCIFLFSCKQTPPVVEDNSPHLPPQVAKIITTKCANETCHNQDNDPNLNLTTWKHIFEGSKNVGAVVVPYNHDWSHLFQHINTFSDLGLTVTEDDRMPQPPLPALSREEVETMKAWILDGAKSDIGEYFWANQEANSGNKLFSLCSGSDLIAVVDIPSNKIMRYITVGIDPNKGESPHYVVLSPDKQYFYVSLIDGTAIEKYRTDNYTKVGRVAVSDNPSIIVLNATGTRLLVTHWNDEVSLPKITLVNTETMTKLQEITDDIPLAHGLAVSPDFRYAYVAPNGGNFFTKFTLASDGNSFVNSDTYPLEPNEPVPGSSSKYYAYQSLLIPEKNQLFISCRNSHEVRVFNTLDNSFIKKIPVDSLPRLMVYDAESKRIFVCTAKGKNTAAQGSIRGSVSVIDAENLTFVQNIYNLGHRPHGIGIDHKTHRLYVSSENTGGIDPPHHPIPGITSPPGKFNVVDMNTLQAIKSMETDLASFPSSLGISE